MLLRDSPQGMEVFMVVRHHQIDFASGALVFPGGKVDKQDLDERVISRLSAYPKAETDQGTLRAAAIREAFEESGILLARRKGGPAVVADSDLDRWREGLNKHTLTLGDLLVEGTWRPATTWRTSRTGSRPSSCPSASTPTSTWPACPPTRSPRTMATRTWTRCGSRPSR
jgi:8-oxo-dGTP pyrophosphatase MutT (NUDIX family)